jgi:hypothetical protein
MNRHWQRFLAICLTALLVVTQLQPALAGFSFGGFQIPTSPGDLTNIGKQKGEEAVLNQLSEQLGQKSPIYLNAHHAFKEVKAPRNFNPQKIGIRSTDDLLQKRPPGDYSIDIVAYCTNRSVHNPGQGLPYTIGMTEGSQTQAISNLTLRGEIVGINRGIMQYMSTAIQAGVPPSQMDRTKRAIIDLVIPEFKQRLEQNGDVYDQYRHTYENFQSKLPARLPYSFDQVLSKIPLGQQIAEAKRIHDLFTNHLDAQQQGGNLYRQLGDGTPETLTTNHPQESPWAQIRDNVIARATVIHGRAGDGSDGINRLEFRILGNSTQGKALKGEKVAIVPILIEGAISIFEILGEVLTTAETAGGAVSAGEGAAAATTIVADGAIAGTEVDVATVAGRAAQARRLTLKSSDILYGSGRALQALTLAPAFNPGGEENALENRLHDEGKGKIPPEWGNGKPTKSGGGWKWFDPGKYKGDGVRIDPGDPNAQYPWQQVDHVSVTYEGKKLDMYGNPIYASTPSATQDAHIPLSVWRTWRFWYKP